MSLIIEILKGTWFKAERKERSVEIKNSDKVRNFVEFIDETSVKIIANSILVGRSSDNNLVLDDIQVSRVHCKIFSQGIFFKKWFVTDLSANGTFLNDFQLKKGNDYPIKKGDKLLLGETMLCFDL